MDEFDARTRRERRFFSPAEHPRGLDGEEGPQPLAAAEHCVAHRLHQPGRTGDLAGLERRPQQIDEEGFDRVGDLSEPVGKVTRIGVRLDRGVGSLR